ncbi:MAG: UDP-3-O-acyl-N-acetylglucosamine deacetylase [Phycisphaeraceae bacterium]|nr:UDP-3-O-acyl-N-acetylglucosamine deacetylase [Phycisphaeraceae bacterium]
MSLPRRTIIGPATVSGVGLFTGKASTVRFVPAGTGGVVFRRVDLPGSPDIPATVASLGPAPAGVPGRNTTLRFGGAVCVTVEHIMSALAGLGITDIVVELDGAEAPIMDGSAGPFAEALWGAGLRYTGAMVEPLRVEREVTVRGEGGAWISARPAAGSVYRYEMDYGAGSALGVQSAGFDAARDEYRREVAPARTFCTLAEAEAMKRAGLFGHLSPRDMLVIGEHGPIENAYRFENEPARHKVLDLIGDLALVGRPIAGEIVAHKAGHALNAEMAKVLVGG